MADSCVFHRRLDVNLPTAVKAEGVWITDTTGKKYLDASGGPICVNVGHGRQAVADAIARQAAAVAYVHGPMFTSDPVENLARALARHAPAGIDRFYFCSSGCEAVETAVKLARQIQLSIGERQRYRIVSRWHSYHGATLGALSVGGKIAMRGPYLPMLPPSIHIAPPYCLRCHYRLTYPSCDLRCAQVLDDVIRLEGAGTIAAFIAEPVCGAALGAVVPPPGYHDRIADICRKHGVMLILDEVMTGMGRTGRWFAAEHDKVRPDIIVLGKGLNSGYQPLSAVGCRSDHLDLLRRADGNFNHGHTFSHHAVAAAAGLKVVEILEEENLIERSETLGRYLGYLLSPLEELPTVAQVRGIGLMWAVELVEDKAGLKPFPRSARVAEKIFERLFDAGIIVYTCTGFVNGTGDAIMLGPPFVITESELDLTVRHIETLIRETAA
jgi:adenosylmethionine-8-amino-7-oxononanoate aminotransferase